MRPASPASWFSTQPCQELQELCCKALQQLISSLGIFHFHFRSSEHLRRNQNSRFDFEICWSSPRRLSRKSKWYQGQLSKRKRAVPDEMQSKPKVTLGYFDSRLMVFNLPNVRRGLIISRLFIACLTCFKVNIFKRVTAAIPMMNPQYIILKRLFRASLRK